MKICCIGIGSLGGAIMRSVCKNFNPKEIIVANRTSEKAKKFAENHGCNFAESNIDAVKNSKYIFIAVKPNSLEGLFQEIGRFIPKDSVVISMAAGVKLEKLEHLANECRFVRIMPNVPAQIGQAMTAICCNDDIEDYELKDIKEILNACGKVEQVPENLMDCVTAVSGSGPAFVFMFIEALADAAVRCGMPRSQAYTYAAQTVYGSAGMVLETKTHPGILKDSVTSPSGTTIEGVSVLEKNSFRSAVIEAVSATYKKSTEMGK